LKGINSIGGSSSWDFINFGEFFFWENSDFLGVLNEDGSDKTVKFELEEDEESANLLIQLVVSIIFGLLGLVALLYICFWIARSNFFFQNFQLFSKNVRFFFPAIC
jgi:hypothetical protein